MKRSWLKYCLLMTAICLSVPDRLHSAEPSNQAPSSPPVEKSKDIESDKQIPLVRQGALSTPKIVYKPPLRGAPAVRIDGGSRGSGVSLISLTVLAPDHAGLTVQDQPSLFWYQSEPAAVPFELTVIVEGKPEPILRVSLPDAKKAGIQHVRLSDYNVRLSPGIEYEWVVALVVDPESRSKDVVASGFIRRAEPSAVLSARLAQAKREDVPYVYAEEGIWYDAIDALSELIAERPSDASLQADNAALLRQVGLKNAATHISDLTR